MFYVLELPVPDEFILGNSAWVEHGTLTLISVSKSVQVWVKVPQS
ncbi:hypothetical protein J699_01923 [Acinetobacter sp. 1000160]|nr:hypothetical protein J699_01923 [Acinetobacter sp. 1000160]